MGTNDKQTTRNNRTTCRLLLGTGKGTTTEKVKVDFHEDLFKLYRNGEAELNVVEEWPL